MSEIGLGYFFKSGDRVRATLEMLSYLEGKGVNGVTYSNLQKEQGKARANFISSVLIPNGYARKQTRFRKQKRASKDYYQRIVKYYITSEGEDLILELENKYKEYKMKALYGRIL